MSLTTVGSGRILNIQERERIDGRSGGQDLPSYRHIFS
jgi:hypothetical protein